MVDQNNFKKIDEIIKRVDRYKIEPIFSEEIESRNSRRVAESLTDNEIMETFITLIAFSQNANSKVVAAIIKSKIFKKIFADFNINEIAKLDPCDLEDKYWGEIGGIRFKRKLSKIVTLAKTIKKIKDKENVSLNEFLTNTEIPKRILSIDDVELFWLGFKKLRGVLTEYKVPFFRSPTSLLHFLLETGYDCIKPDLIVMRVAKKIGIVDKETGNKNLIKTVRTIQEYAIDRNIRPSIIDLYFLIDEGQAEAKKFVEKEFYHRQDD